MTRFITKSELDRISLEHRNTILKRWGLELANFEISDELSQYRKVKDDFTTDRYGMSTTEVFRKKALLFESITFSVWETPVIYSWSGSSSNSTSTMSNCSL